MHLVPQNGLGVVYIVFVLQFSYALIYEYTDGYTGNVYLLVKMLLPTAGKKRVYNLQSKQIVKHLSQVNIYSRFA